MNDNFSASAGSQKEHIITGAFGAIIGTIPGLILWLLLSKIGFLSSLSSVLMIVGVILGYGKFNKDIGKKGAVVCLIVSVIMIYAATHLSWSFKVHSAAKGAASLKFCIVNLRVILKAAGLTVKFYGSLAMGYLISIVALVSLAFKK
ncbi:MAG: hypothetical protein Q4F95_12505 [Oscillospiraceae bacterium]|nr:hypothetical protein [Oscillospiraceae bacterium]